MLQALILAGGKGSRLDPITRNEVPKPLIRVGDFILLERSIEQLLQIGVERILVGCGHFRQHFTYLNTKYKEVETYENPHFDKGSVSTLTAAPNLPDGSVLLLEADLLYEIKALQLLKESIEDNVCLCSNPLPIDDNVFFKKNGSMQLTELSKTMNPADADGVMTGIWKFEADYLNDFIRYAKRSESLNNSLLEKHYEMELLNYAITTNNAIQCKSVDPLNWCEIDSSEHLEYALRQVVPKLNLHS